MAPAIAQGDEDMEEAAAREELTLLQLKQRDLKAKLRASEGDQRAELNKQLGRMADSLVDKEKVLTQRRTERQKRQLEAEEQHMREQKEKLESSVNELQGAVSELHKKLTPTPRDDEPALSPPPTTTAEVALTTGAASVATFEEEQQALNTQVSCDPSHPVRPSSCRCHLCQGVEEILSETILANRLSRSFIEGGPI